MLTQYKAILEKLIDTAGQVEAAQQLGIFKKVLKVQLSINLAIREKLATDTSFVECMCKLLDKGAREEESIIFEWYHSETGGALRDASNSNQSHPEVLGQSQEEAILMSRMDRNDIILECLGEKTSIGPTSATV